MCVKIYFAKHKFKMIPTESYTELGCMIIERNTCQVTWARMLFERFIWIYPLASKVGSSGFFFRVCVNLEARKRTFSNFSKRFHWKSWICSVSVCVYKKFSFSQTGKKCCFFQKIKTSLISSWKRIAEKLPIFSN